MKLHVMIVSCTIYCLLVLCAPVAPVSAETDRLQLANAMSATLDLWRENWIEQLYDRLAHRGAISKEQFAERMRGTSIRPACCWQKMDNFKVLSERDAEATVSAKIGLEETVFFNNRTTPRELTALEYSTREFKLIREGVVWKMQLEDIYSLSSAGAVKKSQHNH
ncbi:MAG: hypothetical protein HXX11_20160 [Desulfuromonadales bacterium]|nr:hypothetical protein [Desulfuromonadales bacterium]